MNKKSFLILPIVLFYSSALMAEGFYAGAGIGITQIEDNEQGLSFEDNPFGWRLLAGYDFNEQFALEGAYVNSGEAEDTVDGTRVKAETTAFTVSVIGLMPVGTGNTRVFGKLGYFDGETEASALGTSITEDDSGLTIGAGLRFDLSNNASIRGEFDWYDADVDTLWSLGVSIQFLFGN